MGVTSYKKGLRKRVGTWASALAIAIGLCAFVTLGWVEAGTRTALEQSVGRALQVTELRGTIAHLDELLTMSARMAALSGNERWIARYNEAEPRLDAAIKKAVALATPQLAAQLARTTDDANRRLVELERASFAYVAAGERTKAWELLNGREYEVLKGVYTEGIQAFGSELEAFATTHTTNLHERSWLETFGLVLGGAVFLLAAGAATRGRAQLQVALSHTEAAARHDPLTGLPNRLKIREHMGHVLEQLRRSGGGAAVFYLDLDGFKSVNDLLGHAAGDQLLCLASARILACVREADLVARLGGDEFAIVQDGAKQLHEVAKMVERLVAIMQEPFAVHGRRVAISASLGVVLANESASPDGLLRDADIALYKAKAEGRCTWRLFTHEMDEQVMLQRTLEADLKEALLQDEFEIFYQPLVCSSTLELVGFEALLHWHHPRRGMVPPIEFIPVAEQLGLIGCIGAWVLKQACTAAVAWPDHLNIAVNLSPMQFMQGDVASQVQNALDSSGLQPQRLELEITESVLLQNNEATLSVLHRLRGLGSRISMDDFGTGYSSLSYLRQFPFDKLKIDKTFLANINREGSDIEILRAMVSLGKALNIKVLVEGVETVDQLKLLQAENCTEFQGYLFGKPSPLYTANALVGSSMVERSFALLRC